MIKGVEILKKKGINMRVIWSLKKGVFVFPEERKNDGTHWVSDWLPQVELLAHPAVKLGITHAGFGATLEFIHATVPVLTWPHFGDQPYNAQNLEEANAGIGLIPWKAGNRNVDITNCSFYKEVFTADDFANKAQKLLTDSKYRQGMLKLKCYARAQGGAKKVVNLVE